ncbi:MAG: biotin/lipoyl-binding protein, partial [Nitrospirae bacterium]
MMLIGYGWLRYSMSRIQSSLKGKVKALVDLPTGLDDIAIDDFATSTQLRAWELARIPDYLRRYGRIAIKLLLLLFVAIAFIPWTQTVIATGQLSAYTPYERPQDIEAQIIARITKWHVFEGSRVKQGELILELSDVDPNFMAPDLLSLLEIGRA